MGALNNGRVESIKVNEGDRVRQDQVIGTMLPTSNYDVWPADLAVRRYPPYDAVLERGRL